MTTQDWKAALRILKPAFERAGITRCEDCGSDNFLSFAHTMKRRLIARGSPLIYKVALLCTMANHKHKGGCHQFYENMPHSIMEAMITKIIDNRETAVII